MHRPTVGGDDADALGLAMGSLSIRDDRIRSLGFFDLPSEIRIRIYELALVAPDQPVDLEPLNHRKIAPQLRCLQVCKQMHGEASGVFYGSQTFRLFPVHYRFFNTKTPLLARLTHDNRACITSMELRLGPGWGQPPRCQKVDEKLGLQDCRSLRRLRIFVELDPSHDVFEGFRGRGVARDTYRLFCQDLVQQIFDRTPSIATIEMDAYPSVHKTSPLVVGLVSVINDANKKLVWGPLRGWDDKEDCGRLGLENALASMSL